MAKTLVTFYSRTGTTKKVAEELAKQLKADLDEIIDTKDRSGPLGYITGGRDAMKKVLTEIKSKKNLAAYELVIIGTPVWGWNVCPAIRTYLTKNKEKIVKVAFFCTMGGSGADGTFKSMEELSKKPVATFSMKEREVKADKHIFALKKFVKLLKK